MRPFALNVKKATQAIRVLLHALGRPQLEYLSLLKMLYIADRESVKDRGRPITGDVAVALKNGPVLSGIYDLINHTREDDLALWATFLGKDEYDLILKADPGTDELSRYEIHKLEEIARTHAGCGWRDMVRITHDFPEWRKNNPEMFGLLMKPIPLKDIFEAVGRGEGMDELLEDAEVVTACQQVLRR